jgi:hypothetical protein
VSATARAEKVTIDPAGTEVLLGSMVILGVLSRCVIAEAIELRALPRARAVTRRVSFQAEAPAVG